MKPSPAAAAALLALAPFGGSAVVVGASSSSSSSRSHAAHPRVDVDPEAEADAEPLAAAATLSGASNLTASALDSLPGSVVGIDARGGVIGTRALRRQLEENPFDLFRPLPCNTAIDTAPCPSWDRVVPPFEPLVIPCGQCVTMDVPAGSEVFLHGGLDIQGKLTFPTNHKVTIRTTHVFLQGVLHIRDTNPISPENESVKFHFDNFEGPATEELFQPHVNNSVGCAAEPGGKCEVGIKPFLVAGGRLDVEGWGDASCPTWTRIQDVVYEDMTTEDFDRPVPAPEGCPRALSDADFEGDDDAHGWRSHLGDLHTIEHDIIEGVDNSWLRVHNRTRDWQGPFFDTSTLKPCLQSGVDYVFGAKIRLTKEDGSGTPTLCSSAGTNCPRFAALSRAADNGPPDTYVKRSMLPEEGMATTDGEWFPLFGKFTFKTEEAAPDSVFETFAIDGPEPGVVIEVDDIYIGLPPESMYHDEGSPGTVCDELFPADSGADGYFDPPRYPYPLYKNTGSGRLIRVLTEEDGNNFYRAQVFQEYESLSFPLPAGCVRGGARYDISFRMRIDSPNSYNGVRAEIRGASTHYARVCPPVGGGRGWVTCEASITVDREDEDNAESQYFRVYPGHDDAGSGDTLVDVDYDDISVRLNHGPVETLVVENEVSTCWGPGSEILVTSHTDDHDGEQIGIVQSVTTRTDDASKADLKLESFVIRPTTVADDPNQATEVALLTRNVRFTSDEHASNQGAYLSVLHTTSVPQVLSGVEIRNFGQWENDHRYSFMFEKCSDVQGSVISKNAVREGRYRGIALAGTHNVTILENVVYDTRGDAFALLHGKEWDNRIEFNLAARTRNINNGDTASFLLRSVQNYIIGNVAAGAAERGFYFHLPGSINPGSRDLPGENHNPRSQLGLEIRDNVAHSCDDYGIVISSWKAADSVPLRNFRLYKNEDNGSYLRGYSVKFVGAYFADNRIKSVDFHYCDSCELRDSDVIGVTPLALDQSKADQVWHQCLDSPDSDNKIVGIEFKHFTDNKAYISPGAVLENVRFSGFENTGCADPKHLYVENHRRMPHWDYGVQMTDAVDLEQSAEGTPFRPDFCSAEKLEVQDVLFTDLNSALHPDGPGSYNGTSSLVSNHPWMKGFAAGQCYDYDTPTDRCASYCEGLCLRFVNFYVDAHGTEDVVLNVTDTATGKSIEIGGNFDFAWKDGEFNVYHNSYNYDLRVFSVPLPDSTFAAEFRLNGQPYWPTFVERGYEPAPSCGGAREGSVTFLEPPITDECSNMVKNGDGELGNYTGWYHVSGGVRAVNGSGVGGSYALVSDKRNDYYDGLAFYADTRCVKAGAGKEFELRAYMKVEDAAGNPITCNPDSISTSASKQACPRFTAKGKIWDPDAMSYATRYWYLIAVTTRPYNADGYTLVQGTFVMPQDFVDSDSVLFYFSQTVEDYKIYLDDVSLGPLDTPTRNADGCASGELVVNGDVEMQPSSTQYWDVRRDRAGTVDVSSPGADGSGHAIKSAGRTDKYQGPGQYLNPACLVDGQEYQVSAKFRLTLGADGSHVECDPTKGSGYADSCPVLTLKTWTGNLGSYSNSYPKVGFVADAGSESVWGTVHGTFFPTQPMLDSYMMYAYFEYPGPGVDIEIDDFTVTAYTLDCSNVVKNGDFERGDFGFWGGNGGSPYMASPGANGTAYAYGVSGRTNRAYGPEHTLEPDCVAAGEQYLVEARFKLQSGGSDFPCDPNVIYGDDGCPTAALVSVQGGGSRVRIRDVAAAVGQADGEGWYTLKGVFEMYESDVASEEVKLRFKDAPANVDLIVDEVRMTKVENPIQ